MSPKAKRLVAYCKINNRICPHKWQEMYELLPNKTQNPNGSWTPSLPLILAACHETPAIMKMMRLKEHIEYADKNGAIDSVNSFIRSLDEDQWHHIGDYL